MKAEARMKFSSVSRRLYLLPAAIAIGIGVAVGLVVLLGKAPVTFSIQIEKIHVEVHIDR
jgi:hypothetical protein